MQPFAPITGTGTAMHHAYSRYCDMAVVTSRRIIPPYLPPPPSLPPSLPNLLPPLPHTCEQRLLVSYPPSNITYGSVIASLPPPPPPTHLCAAATGLVPTQQHIFRIGHRHHAIERFQCMVRLLTLKGRDNMFLLEFSWSSVGVYGPAPPSCRRAL